MPKYRPLKFRETVKILQNLGFTPAKKRSTSHQTWVLKKDGQYFAITLAFHGKGKEFRKGTLASIIRQSGFPKKEFYQALKKKRKPKI